jgi:hypothetical protein
MNKIKPSTQEKNEVNEVFGEVIDTYSKQDAIEDGILIDITDLSITKEAGYKIPVVITQGVYSLVSVPKGLEGIQDFNGRLWDVLQMSTLAFRSCRAKHQDRAEKECRIVPFKVIFQISPEKEIKKTGCLNYETVKLWLVFNAHEGFTIMKPEEY